MTQAQQPSQPWWKVGSMWLVVLGPVTVVIAGFVTLFIAMRVPDPVVTDDHHREGPDISKMKAEEAQMMPAIQARNHAATPKGDATSEPKP